MRKFRIFGTTLSLTKTPIYNLKNLAFEIHDSPIQHKPRQTTAKIHVWFILAITNRTVLKLASQILLYTQPLDYVFSPLSDAYTLKSITRLPTIFHIYVIVAFSNFLHKLCRARWRPFIIVEKFDIIWHKDQFSLVSVFSEFSKARGTGAPLRVNIL